MASHDNKIPLGSTSGEFINLGNLGRQRFLDEDVFASIEDLLGKGEVTCSRGSNDHAIDLGIFQNNPMAFDSAAEREICLHKLTAFRARIRHVLDHAPRQGREIAQQVRAPVAAPDLGKY